MLKVFFTICCALLLFSCSNSPQLGNGATKESSDSYYRFHITKSQPTSSNIYYVFPENETWGKFSVYRVIEPIEDIDSYDEVIIDGRGPDGSGKYRMRIVTDQEQIESYSWVFFLVSGI